MKELTDLQRLIRNQFRRKTIAPETKEYANHRLRDLRPQLLEVTRADAYEDHLLTTLQAERDKFQLYRRTDPDERPQALEESPYEDLREKPVCTCSGKLAHQCPIKRGRLPREVRTASDLDAGIREFKAAHGGNPVVLVDAQRDWGDRVGEVEYKLREILSVLSADRIPEDADWPPVSGNGHTKPDEQTAD